MKKILSLLLVLTMVFSLSSTSFAAAGDSVPASGEEEIDNFYEKYTIDFSSNIETYTAEYSPENANEQNIEKAKDYVMSLNLSTSGLQAIEDACLSHLNVLEDELNKVSGTLCSYSVLVPRNRALSYTYYGSYSGKDFYYAYYDEYTYSLEKSNDYNTDMMKHWISGVVNAVLLLPHIPTLATISWNVFSAMGIPQKYEINNSAYTKRYAIVDISSRGIYWTQGSSTSTYKLVYEDEKGLVTPSFLFYPVDSSLPKSVYEARCKEVAIRSDNFNDKEYILDSANYAAVHEMQFREPIYIGSKNVELRWEEP